MRHSTVSCWVFACQLFSSPSTPPTITLGQVSQPFAPSVMCSSCHMLKLSTHLLHHFPRYIYFPFVILSTFISSCQHLLLHCSLFAFQNIHQLSIKFRHFTFIRNFFSISGHVYAYQKLYILHTDPSSYFVFSSLSNVKFCLTYSISSIS